MENKKIYIFGVLAELTLGCVVSAAFGGPKEIFKMYAGSNEVWSHYSGVGATFETKGIKEYWVSCMDSSHQFTAPVGANIVDKGAPGQEFIDDLSDGDDRLILSYDKVMGFEDGKVPSFLKKNDKVTGAEISDDGVDGSKALKISVKAGDFQFGFDKAYLDAAFKDSKVKAVAFDAKSTVATQNWRYNTPEGEPSTSASQPFEDYEVGAGLTTEWKTFYFTRKMYNSWVDGTSYMIKGSTGEATVYIDNVRPVDYDLYNNISMFGFETNTLKKTKANEFSVRRGAGKEALKVSGAGVVDDSWSYSYDMKTEGNRSLKFQKQNGYIAIYLSTEIINAIPGDYVVFDLYTTTGFNSMDSNKGMCTGMNGVINNQKATQNSKWQTLTFKKNCNGTGDITTDGRLLQIQGSPACDVYIDNIRGLSKLDDLESAYAFHVGQYGTVVDYKTATTEAAGNTIRDANKNYTFIVNGACCAGTEVTTEKSSSGNCSVKYTWSGKGYCAMFINPVLLDMVLPRGFSISFDIWASTSFTGGTFMGNAVNSHIGNWTTVTLSESNFEKASSGNLIYNGRFSTASFNDAGTFYLDNFQLIAPAE